MITLYDIKARDWHKRLVSRETSPYGEDDERLIMEWRDITMTTTDQVLLDIQKKIVWCGYVLDMTSTYSSMLSVLYHQDIANDLMRLYPDVKISEENKEESLKKVLIKSTRYKLEYDNAIKDRNRLSPPSDEKPTMQYYAKLNNAINQMQGFPMHPEISAAEWAELYKQLIETAEKPQVHA